MIINKLSLLKRVNQDFFKFWTAEMSYVLGYITADGCVIKRKNRQNSYIFNITSKDKKHLLKIRKTLNSNYPLSIKHNSQGMPCSQIQICNKEICKDLINLGILPRKTSCLKPIIVPKKYFPDFVRGFFDGDGTVYVYKVNGTVQIKAGFVSTSLSFFNVFNERLCKNLDIPIKSIHRTIDKRGKKKMVQFSVCFYIDDCEKLANFMYSDNPSLYLSRKRNIFDKWKSVGRRHYVKQSYPSKIGWHLNLCLGKISQNRNNISS
ncbi:MAG: LAGLIDADG family homing endonuclease [Candidatus Nealsonbacteria bacterium]